MTLAISGTNAPMQFSGDFDTDLQMVQSQRANLLEGQLEGQLNTVKQHNTNMQNLNDISSQINIAVSKFSGTDATSKISDLKDPAKGQAQAAINQAKSLASSNGATVVGDPQTLGDLNTLITTIKGQVDAESNNQQMDMLRLQSLMSKRNETTDLMTDTMKKASDTRSEIIGNIR